MKIPTSRPGERGAAIAVAAILVAAALLRIRDMIATPLWFDEIYSLWTARGGLRDALRLAAADVHPPLHPITLVAWRAIGGEGGLWLGALPLAFSMATIVAWLGFARDLFGAPAAAGDRERRASPTHTPGRTAVTVLLSGALLAVHPFHIHLSHELRWFSLFWLLSTLTAWGAWRWHRRGRARDATMFVLAATAMLYTHYLGGVVLAAIAAWGLVVASRDGGRLVRWLALLGAVALLFMPQLPILIEQAGRQQHHWITSGGLSDLGELLRKFSLSMSYLAPALLALAVLPLAIPRTSGAAAYLWVVGGVPVLGAWAATAAGGHLFSERYMTFALPFWCGLIAAGVAAVPRAWVRAALGAVILLLGARAAWITLPSIEPASLADAARRLRVEAAPEDTVFHADTHSLLYFRHHAPDHGRHVLLMTETELPYYEGAAVIPPAWRLGPADLARVAGAGRPWWGVLTRKAGGDTGPAMLLLSSLSCCPPDTFGIVTVWRGRAASEGSPRVDPTP